MITNVTNVLVASAAGVVTTLPTAAAIKAAAIADAGKYIVVNGDDSIKIGLITNKTVTTVNPTTKNIQYLPLIKWAKEIKDGFIKSVAMDTYKANTEDTAVISFTAANGDDRKRILLRVTYKDMETRYRKWTETYEVVVEPNATAAQIAQAFKETLTKNAKRNRFDFTLSGTTLTLTAKEYEDDNAVDTINVSKKVRFDVHMYYTMPDADGWASKNKYAYSDATIAKTDGVEYQAAAKLVRDREAWAMGYDGILNRGNGTWPIIKPDMNVKLDGHYNVLTIEFNNQYRAADDIVRYTRNTIELYSETATDLNTIKGVIDGQSAPAPTSLDD